jgi:phosphotransferase system enzyme I (PtsI)
MSSNPLTDTERHFTGLAASPGVGFGQVARLVPQTRPPLFIHVLPHRVTLEIERVKRAMQRARRHLEGMSSTIFGSRSDMARPICWIRTFSCLMTRF